MIIGGWVCPVAYYLSSHAFPYQLTLPEACNASGSVPQDCRSALFNLRSTIPLCFNRSYRGVIMLIRTGRAIHVS
ncbi:Uncharacterized protein HZ326_1320 [Fusarium oxysporum f. sp. albedinis]|nr:Uncharacterized protein HZ326_1320 [Fusarium oxysporum f. sp. albedinis]